MKRKLMALALVLSLTASMTTAALANNAQADRDQEAGIDFTFEGSPGIVDPEDPDPKDPEEEKWWQEFNAMDLYFGEWRITPAAEKYDSVHRIPNADGTWNKKDFGVGVVSNVTGTDRWEVRVQSGGFYDGTLQSVIGYELFFTPVAGKAGSFQSPTPNFTVVGNAGAPLQAASGGGLGAEFTFMSNGLAGLHAADFSGQLDTLANSTLDEGKFQAEVLWQYIAN